jgi:CheY-like chemotaxis protein
MPNYGCDEGEVIEMDSEKTNGAALLSAPPAINPVYDPGPLDAFIADLGDEGVGVRAGLFEAFLDQSTSRFIPLLAADNDAKREVLASLAHAMRSSSAALGLTALSTAAADIEVALRTTPELVNVPRESTRLLNEFQRASVVVGALLTAARSAPKLVPDFFPGAIPTVLLVEDDVVSQRACAAVLTKLGYNMKVAVNGSDALEDLQRHRYVAVLMDFRMPVLDGFMTTRELRRREGRGHHTPVIGLSSPITEWDRTMCMEAGGMDDYLTKPIDVAKLTVALARWVPPKDG